MYAEFRKLLQILRAEVGEGFLRTGRLVIMHPLHTNVFLETHAYNFPFAKQDGMKRGDEGGLFKKASDAPFEQQYDNP